MTNVRCQGSLHPTPPFDFDIIRDHIQLCRPLRQLPPAHGTHFFRAMAVEGHPLLLRLGSIGSIDVPVLNYAIISGQPVPDGVKFTLLRRVDNALSLYADLQPFYSLAVDDPVFRSFLPDLRGFRPPRFFTIFECICWRLMRAQMPSAEAHALRTRLHRAIGPQVKTGRLMLNAAPEPADLLALPEIRLIDILGDGYLARNLREVAGRLGESTEDALHEYTDELLLEWLNQLQGIDEHSAYYIAAHGGGRLLGTATPDAHLHAAMMRLYGSDVLDRQIAKYGRWVGLWAAFVRAASIRKGRTDGTNGPRAKRSGSEVVPY